MQAERLQACRIGRSAALWPLRSCCTGDFYNTASLNSHLKDDGDNPMIPGVALFAKQGERLVVCGPGFTVSFKHFVSP
jgi:hypothetical protein